jgi:hypothetical protein
MEISDERKEKIWDTILKEQGILPEERTKKMLMEEYNLTLSRINHLVEKLLIDGVLTRRYIIINGKKCVVYKVVE